MSLGGTQFTSMLAYMRTGARLGEDCVDLVRTSSKGSYSEGGGRSHTWADNHTPILQPLIQQMPF